MVVRKLFKKKKLIETHHHQQQSLWKWIRLVKVSHMYSGNAPKRRIYIVNNMEDMNEHYRIHFQTNPFKKFNILYN